MLWEERQKSNQHSLNCGIMIKWNLLIGSTLISNCRVSLHGLFIRIIFKFQLKGIIFGRRKWKIEKIMMPLKVIIWKKVKLIHRKIRLAQQKRYSIRLGWKIARVDTGLKVLKLSRHSCRQKKQWTWAPIAQQKHQMRQEHCDLLDFNVFHNFNKTTQTNNYKQMQRSNKYKAKKTMNN